MPKMIEGLAYDDFKERVIECFETEFESGGRFWRASDEFDSKSVYEAAVRKTSDRGELSDTDLVVYEKQPDDIRKCLEAMDKLESDWRKTDEGKAQGSLSWQEMFEKFGVEPEKRGLSRTGVSAPEAGQGSGFDGLDYK